MGLWYWVRAVGLSVGQLTGFAGYIQHFLRVFVSVNNMTASPSRDDITRIGCLSGLVPDAECVRFTLGLF